MPPRYHGSPLLYAHRGVHHHEPENTLGAFAAAIELGADGVELDVRRCRSGEVVVFHDPDLLRMAQDPGERGRIVADSDYNQLRDVQLAGAQRIPLLDEVLDLLLDAGLRINVEVKSDLPDRQDLIAATARVLGGRAAAERQQLLVSCFSRSMLEALAATLPDITMAWLVAKPPYAPPAAAGALHPGVRALDVTALQAVRAAGLAVNVWTVNDPERALELAALGVDGLITDELAALQRALQMRSTS
ncbi:MAG: glycerophosphodiester phosphodiesterase [Myxococcales bacterium]|nr:glycerophosphodiester phosphodiesterase [Myxococcales bacterium]